MQIIENLKSLGYEVELTGDNLKLTYRGEGQPDKDKIIPLLDTLKKNKGEVIEYLTFKVTPIPFKTLWMMFKDTLGHIDNPFMDDKAWGGIMQTFQYRQAWGRLNDICLDCMGGRAGIGEYQDTLKEWQRVVKG